MSESPYSLDNTLVENKYNIAATAVDPKKCVPIDIVNHNRLGTASVDGIAGHHRL